MLPGDSKKLLATCPMCKGRGYCEQDKSPNSNYARPAIRFPPINLQPTNSTPLLRNGANTTSPSTNLTGDTHLPSILCSRNGTNQSNFISNAGDNATTYDQDFVGAPEIVENPQEVFRLALLKLKQHQWETSMQALIEIMQVSRIKPELVDSSMPVINRGICSLLKNIRSQVVRTACQVSMELFRTMQCTQRPEFDELVAVLLQKTAHMNKVIREDANKALDAMITFIPVPHCVRIMASCHGAGHKNPLVRSAVSRLIYCIVIMIRVDALLSATALKDTRRRIFTICAKFLIDGNCETRSNAKKLMKLFMSSNEFENLFHQEVDRKLTDRIQKQFIALKYDIKLQSDSQVI